MGRRRLSGRARPPAPRPGGAAPAGPVARHSPGSRSTAARACARRGADAAGADAAARAARAAGPRRRPRARRGGARHGRGGRCRHPQPHPLRSRRTRASTSSGRSSSRPRSATSTASSSTACRAPAARSAPAATRAPAASRAIPPTQEPLAFYSGIVRVGPDGTAERALRHPGLQRHRPRDGGAPGRRTGSAAPPTDVIIRDPVVLAGTLPRFLSIGDQSRLLMQVAQCRAAGRRVHGRGRPRRADPDPGRRAAAAAAARPRTGAAASPSRSRPPAPARRSSTSRVSGGGFDGHASASRCGSSPAAPASCAAPCGRSSRARASTVSRRSPRRHPARAPARCRSRCRRSPPSTCRGCSRPSTAIPTAARSRRQPRDAAALREPARRAARRLALDDEADERVRDAIERVLARQGSNGSFGLWGVGGEDIWLDAYVTDFLTRARERGFAVPQVAFTLALDRLRNFVANTTEVDGQRGRARLCGLCAGPQRPSGDGRPALSRRHQDERLRHAAGARADRRGAGAARRSRPGAERPSRRRSQRLRESRDTGAYRGDYGSRLRDGAGPPGARLGGRARRATRSRRSARSIEEERAPVARDQHAGERLDGARRPGAAARCRGDRPQGRRRRRRRAPSTAPTGTRPCTAAPVTIANAGSGAGPGGGQRHRQPDRLRAGPVARLHGRAELLPARRRAGVA